MTRTLADLYTPGRNEPLGLRVDDVVYVTGLEPEGREAAPSLDGIRRQTAGVLDRMQTLLKDAGGSVVNVARVTGYVRHAGEQREAVYDVWDKLFPRADDKPAFKILDADLPQGILVRFDFLALLGHTRRRIDIPNVDARDPTVRIGPWLLTSRLHGTSPETGETVAGLEAQARQALRNGIRLVELAGGSKADVMQVVGFGRDLGYEATLRAVLREEFGERQPPVQAITTFVRPVLEVMVEITACIND